MTLGDRERRWRKRGHLSFPPLLSESHSHRRAQLGKALGSGRPTPGVTDKETEAQKGGVTMAEWVGCGWQPRRGWSQPLGLFHLYPLPVSCWKGPGPGSPRSTKPAVLSTKEREGNWRLCPKAAHSGCQCPGRWTRAPGSPRLLLGLAHLKASTPGRHGGSGGGAGRKLSTKAFHQRPVRGWNQTMCGEGSERTCYFFHILQEPTPCGPREHLRLPKVNQRQSCPQGTPSPTGETDE